MYDFISVGGKKAQLLFFANDAHACNTKFCCSWTGYR